MRIIKRRSLEMFVQADLERIRFNARNPFACMQFYFAAGFLIVVVAFWPSFFSKLTTIDAAHLIHGVTATLWMAVPVIQARLIARKRFARHRLLGWATLAIAPALVLSSLRMVQLMIVRYEQTHALRLLKFTFLDLTALSLFVAFLLLAIRSARRRDVGSHARYMTSTVLFALEPAMERIFVFYVPGVEGFAQALYLALGTMEILAAAILFIDWRRSGRVSAPFAVTLSFFVAIHVLATAVASTSYFERFAIWFASI